MLCKLGFGAEFWRVGPTVRTGQSHISRAFMCANTRLLYLSPNMSAPLVLTAAQRPDSHQNIDPCHPDCASPRTKNAPLRSFSPAFLGRSMPVAGVLSDFWGWFEATKKWIYSNKNICAYFDFVWPLLHELSRSSPKHFLIFLASDPTCALPPSSSQREITLKQPEASCLHLATIVYTCLQLSTHVCPCLFLFTLVCTCLHLSALVFSCLLYSTHLHNFTNC